MISVNQRKGSGESHPTIDGIIGRLIATDAIGALIGLRSKACRWGRHVLSRIRRLRGHILGSPRSRGRHRCGDAVGVLKHGSAAKRKYLRCHDVKPFLEALNPEWRSLIACALYAGLRKGELLALRKADIDWTSSLIFVRRSHDQGIKQANADNWVPIADELRPYLQHAVEHSLSELVFPRSDGSMRGERINLGRVLRDALMRAGSIDGDMHDCRQEGSRFLERRADEVLRRCPTCNMSLSATACVRETRFQDLRNTTRSLLLSAGANPAAVHRILRDGDPRTATDVYGDFSPEYLRSEINRLRFDSASGAVAPSSC